MRNSRLAFGALCAAAALGACGPAPPPAPLPYAQPLSASDRAVDATPLRGRRILLDPGHGGRFAGAVGEAGNREADVNLGVALALWGMLRDAGADVHLTRSCDRDLLPAPGGPARADLAARVHAIDSLRPEVFLSLHHNSNAARERERNAIETYFKLDEAGPSLDLGRAIAARLARHLGGGPATLVPGNYYVLRDAPGAAVLSEPSYLSNPRVEQQLELAASQRLEAEAYFLGLVDYFARGAGAIDKCFPATDTLPAGAHLRFACTAPLDPLTVEVRADGQPVACTVEAAGAAIVASATLAPGAHAVEVRGRLASGNAAAPWRGRLWVHSAPARALVRQEPPRAAVGETMRLCIAVQDSGGRAVGSGVQVQLGGTGLQYVTAESVTTGGTVLALARATGPAAAVHVRAGALAAELPLRVGGPAGGGGFVRCVDARDGRCVPHAWLAGAVAESDRTGSLPFPAGAESLHVAARGYMPWYGALPADSLLRLVPLHDGSLHDVAFVLDPQGNDADFPSGVGAAPAGAAFAICRALGELLGSAGARCTLTREELESPSDLQRLQSALRADPTWYVGLECGTGAAAVLHDPTSAAGEELAQALATWLQRRLGSAYAVRAETRFMLRQTPCPAAIVRLPAAAGRTPQAARQAAYALFLGVRDGITSDPLPPGSAGGEVVAPPGAALAELDGAAVLPLDGAGRFRFDAVEPGVHRLRLLGAWPTQAHVRVGAGADTARVRFTPPMSH